MRIIDSIPHPSMSISIFQMNDKYIVKFEAGPMEQSYKFSVTEMGGLENLKQKVSNEFIEKVRKRFNEMYTDLSNLVSK